MGVWQVPDEEETDSHRSTPVIPLQRESPVKLASVEEEEEEPEEEKPISSVVSILVKPLLFILYKW